MVIEFLPGDEERKVCAEEALEEDCLPTLSPVCVVSDENVLELYQVRDELSTLAASCEDADTNICAKNIVDLLMQHAVIRDSESLQSFLTEFDSMASPKLFASVLPLFESEYFACYSSPTFVPQALTEYLQDCMLSEFLEGILEGVVAGLAAGDEDSSTPITLGELKGTLYNMMGQGIKMSLLSPVSTPVFLVATLHGVLYRVYDDLSGIVQLFTQFGQLKELVLKLVGDQGTQVARAMGKSMGESSALMIYQTLNEESFLKYVYNMGFYLGPIIIDILLWLVGGLGAVKTALTGGKVAAETVETAVGVSRGLGKAVDALEDVADVGEDLVDLAQSGEHAIDVLEDVADVGEEFTERTGHFIAEQGKEGRRYFLADADDIPRAPLNDEVVETVRHLSPEMRLKAQRKIIEDMFDTSIADDFLELFENFPEAGETLMRVLRDSPSDEMKRYVQALSSYPAEDAAKIIEKLSKLSPRRTYIFDKVGYETYELLEGFTEVIDETGEVVRYTGLFDEIEDAEEIIARILRETEGMGSSSLIDEIADLPLELAQSVLRKIDALSPTSKKGLQWAIDLVEGVEDSQHWYVDLLEVCGPDNPVFRGLGKVYSRVGDQGGFQEVVRNFARFGTEIRASNGVGRNLHWTGAYSVLSSLDDLADKFPEGIFSLERSVRPGRKMDVHISFRDRTPLEIEIKGVEVPGPTSISGRISDEIRRDIIAHMETGFESLRWGLSERISNPEIFKAKFLSHIETDSKVLEALGEAFPDLPVEEAISSVKTSFLSRVDAQDSFFFAVADGAF